MDILSILWCLFWLCIYGALAFFVWWVITRIAAVFGANLAVDPRITGLLGIALVILVVILLVACVLGGGEFIPHPPAFWGTHAR